MTLTYPVVAILQYASSTHKTLRWVIGYCTTSLNLIVISYHRQGLVPPTSKKSSISSGMSKAATSKAQSKLVSRFGLHEFSLHWCECFCSSYIARRLHWGASLPGPSLKPCFRWVFPMFVSAIRMCSRCRGGDKCSQTNIEFRFVVLQKRGETSLHKCADLQVSSCPPEMNLFDVNCLANFTCCMPWKPHPTGLPLTNAWCLAAVVFTQLLDGPWQKVTKIHAFPVLQEAESGDS